MNTAMAVGTLLADPVPYVEEIPGLRVNHNVRTFVEMTLPRARLTCNRWRRFERCQLILCVT